MMRESVSHPKNTYLGHLSACLEWCVLVGIGAITVLVGIGILIALMSPENLRTVPTIALVCVLVLLCVPVPVLMLERRHRRSVVGENGDLRIQSTQSGIDPGFDAGVDRGPRQSVVHQSHQPHDSNPDTHRVVRPIPDRKRVQSGS